jgi:hypothetical protein
VKHPVSGDKAKALLRQILASETLSFSNHAYDEMDADSLDEADVRNTLRGGWFCFTEEKNGSWRYRFETNKQGVVVAFRSETVAVVVTTFRIKKR